MRGVLSWEAKEEHFREDGGEWKAPGDSGFMEAIHAQPSMEVCREMGGPAKLEAITSHERD